MRVLRTRRGRLRAVILSGMLGSILVGCGKETASAGPNSTTDPKAGTRRKEMKDFMDQQPPSEQK